jgi:hypothetical protein
MALCLKHSDRISCDRLSYILITPAKVLSAIKRLKLSATAGPDYIPPIFLQQVTISSLCIFRPVWHFTQLVNSAVVPDELRIAFVTPLFKKGTSSGANHYSPISLTWQGCKLIEITLHREMLDFLLKRKLIVQRQHGFLAIQASMLHKTTR